MRGPPIPQRIAPLSWRKPAFMWTPLSLALAIGWPAAAFYNQPSMQRLTVIAGAVVFALALISLGAAWAIGRAPRTRRVAVLHVLFAGVFTALAAPFALTELLAAVANYERDGAGAGFTPGMALALTPLALMLGLPIALVSGMVFAWTALTRQPIEDRDYVLRDDIQPFN